MLNDRLFRKYYLAALSAIGFFLPLSEWLLTFFMIILGIVWLADHGIRKIAEMTGIKKSVMAACLVYLVYLIWMINTTDISYGIRELKIKLPILIFPVVIGLSQPLSKKELKIIVTFFIAGVVVSSLLGIFLKAGQVFSGIAGSREISVFISHIRLALMSDLAIFASIRYFFSGSQKKTLSQFLYPAAAIWLTVFLFFLLSVTGIVIFVLILLCLIIYIPFSSATVHRKCITVLISLAIVLSVSFYIFIQIRSFYRQNNSYPFPLENLTANGNPYQHYSERKDIENGNLVWLYINEDELRKEWNLRSKIPFDSTDNKGQNLKYTLIRYLTSAGLRKDSIGFASLSVSDINYIENGITNVLFTEGKPIRAKIYEIIWQIDYYRKGGNPSGHSVTQRIVFLKTSWKIFLRHPVFGAGTGDLPDEFVSQYRLDNSLLDPKYRLLAHNQYLTFLVSFGVIGFIIICFSIIFPVLWEKGLSDFLARIFFTIIFLSMLCEDTLETHTGVSFFAYFYSLFIFGKDESC